MSIHKLTAGRGYDYLTRQVAALDATDKGHTGLASYYTARGETPGNWTGSGLAGIDGLAAGDVVTAEQMQALFGAGMHPLAADRAEQLEGPALHAGDYAAVTRLGTPFKVFRPDVSPYRREVAARIAAFNTAAGLPGDWPVEPAVRARVRTDVAVDFFTAEHGRAPVDARELSGTIARLSRPQTTAVAGFDLTFSPVKSVSTLWALAPSPVAAEIERAHQAAVADTIRFLETHAIYTREGAGGVRQVDVTGMVATAFTHRDSRAGDPDLHTHLAVANKVQTSDGRWLAIDGRILFKATVAASETYNTALEQYLTQRLGVTFAERPSMDRQKRPVRELVGVDPRLMERWSARRHAITDRQADLTTAFQAAHGRPPTPVEAVRLAQQATLETRQAKHSPRTLAEQRTAWRSEARQVLGSEAAIRAMIAAALQPPKRHTVRVDAAWVAETAASVVASVERRRATWQTWHVRAEAQRRIRAVTVAPDRSEALVDLIVDTALTELSTRLARPAEPATEPALLRRRDGNSVYTVAGSDLHTSPRMLAAEQHLVDSAGRVDGHHLAGDVVSLSLLEATANGARLDDGQARLVRDLATSGRRLQLAIAPAGAGKTTALHALTAAWTAGGGTVIGLAPSAAAAAQLADHTRLPTDTLAQLAWNLDEGTPLPAWADTIDAKSLVIIDEAGMADTLSLDTAVTWIISRGASVRLVGDDQQLAAIGAGGVLRDIDTTHGAARLTELHRFTDPAEAAATLALRDGQPEALGFYLDQHRVHVADPTTIADHLFTGWAADTTTGADALMLAATRDQAADLNARARTHRLTTTNPDEGVPDREVVLADGNRASVGDLIITRTNNRQLRTTATDWVKNGDRWTITAITHTGHVTAQHRTHGHHVSLPPDYIARSVELGYATTIHAAQGVTADTTHGLITGTETRQQLYTMATRGRTANHLYVTVGVDGDPHNLIRPDATHPRTATDILEGVLARDGAATSATTLQRQLHDPAPRLSDAAARYTDALHTAAEHIAGQRTLARIERHAEQLLPGLTDQPAWPTLRARLALIAAAGDPPEPVIDHAATSRELGTAADPAAVLTWRLHHPTLQQPGPLPWLTAIPKSLTDHPDWGPYLTARAHLVTDLAEKIRHDSQQEPAAEAGSAAACAADLGLLPNTLVGNVAVWRAATGVDPTDQRPTGPRQHAGPLALWQRRLDQQLGDRHHEALAEWRPLLTRLAPAVTKDPHATVLAVRLANLSRAGHPAADLLHTAAGTGALPDDHPAAALWWRIRHHLADTSAASAVESGVAQLDWRADLIGHCGPERVASLQASPWWPTLAEQVDRNLQRGTPLDQLIPAQPVDGLPLGADEAQALTWRAQLLTQESVGVDHATYDEAPADLWDGVDPGIGTPVWTPEETPLDVLLPNTTPVRPALPPAVTGRRPELAIAARLASTPDPDGEYLNADLAVAALARQTAGPPSPSDAMLQHAHDRKVAWQKAPVTRERLLHITELAATYYETQLPGSWADTYLTDRLNHHLTGDPTWRPGRAPAAWSGLVTHLRAEDVTDQEMVLAGVASYTRTGTLIDRFRDRLILPILDNYDVLGFVGRANPNITDPRTPKYLNTPDSLLFHKRDQLYGLPHTLPAGATPILVEGPVDAIAVTLAGQGKYIGAAPLGTALTEEQAAQLAHHRIDPIIAYDNDPAGQTAAERAYLRLAPHRLSPLMGQLPAGVDPAQWIHEHGPQPFLGALQQAQPLARWLLGRALDEDPAMHVDYAVLLTELDKPSEWNAAIDKIAAATATPPAVIRALLLHAVSITPTRGLQRQQRLGPKAPVESDRADVESQLVLLAEARGRDQRMSQGKSESDIDRDEAVRR